MKFHRLLVLFLLLFTGCKEKKQYEEMYYATGEAKYKAEVKDGKRNGWATEYYENGKTKSIQYWNNDLPDGKTTYYFDDGAIESISNWKNGKRSGLLEVYYKSGTVRSSGTFFNDHQIGTHSFYYEDGSIMEIDKYDSLGNAMDYEKYDSLGQLRYEMKDAITFLKSDTINLGESVTLTGHLGNNISNVNMIIGKRYNDSGFLEDTFATVFPIRNDDGCIYDFKPSKTGEGFLVGYMQEIHKMPDSSIAVQLYPFLESYFVTSQSLGLAE